MTQRDLGALGATHITVGLSAIIQLTPSAYQYSGYLKILSGGGTLEIVSQPTALTGAGATGWGGGYPIGASEIFPVNGPETIWLAATGATMVVVQAIGKTQATNVTGGFGD